MGNRNATGTNAVVETEFLSFKNQFFAELISMSKMMSMFPALQPSIKMIVCFKNQNNALA